MRNPTLVIVLSVSLVACESLEAPMTQPTAGAPVARPTAEAPEAHPKEAPVAQPMTDPQQAEDLAALVEGFEPLRARFDRDAQNTRLLLLLSPTCPQCLHGANIVQKEIVSQVPSKRLSVFVVWGPFFGKDSIADARAETKRISDPRVTHYWDDGSLGRAMGVQLAIPPAPNPAWDRQGTRTQGTAWDVFLLFPPGARWGETVPKPAFWMHQLGNQNNAPRLDGPLLRERVVEAIGQ